MKRRRFPLPAAVAAAILSVPLHGMNAQHAGNDFIAPAENLRVEGIPPIPKSLAAQAGRYTEFRSASFQSWHPQRREMLIRTRFGDAAQIHRVAFPGGARRQLTFFAEPVGGASYPLAVKPYFVFMLDRGGDEFYQIYRMDISSGRETLLTDGKKRHALGPWSRGGNQLAYRKVDAGAQGAVTELWTIRPDVPDSARHVTTFSGGGWAVNDWSPDDSTWLATHYISINESHLWLVDLETGKKERLAPEPGGPPSAWSGARFAGDGQHIYAATDHANEFRQLVRLQIESGESQTLTESIPWDVSEIEVSPDGHHVAFVTNEAGISRLHLLDAASGREIKSPDLPTGVFGGMQWHSNGRDLALTLSSARASADVYSVDIESGEVQRWTESETGGLRTDTFAEPELIRWPSFDDRQISGFLYTPPAKFTGKRPVIIDIHGGPESQSRPRFQGSDNYFLNELGIALIYPNVRGSAGYGKTFLQLDNGLRREGTYKDIAALLDWIAARDDLDSDRIMVTGGSYGGHMTLAIATFYSDRIRCAVDVVGISNLRTFLENTQGYRRDLRRVEYGDERDPEMRAFLDRIAPLSNAERIRKPLLVIQGANDPRVPQSESDQIVATLRSTGTPVWYLVASDEGHGFKKKPNRDFAFYATALFTKMFLLD